MFQNSLPQYGPYTVAYRDRKGCFKIWFCCSLAEAREVRLTLQKRKMSDIQVRYDCRPIEA